MFEISESFKENKQQLAKFQQENPSEFREFINSIRKELLFQIESE